jgi:RNA polymerase sigma-70 factor (ECF subfamily)
LELSVGELAGRAREGETVAFEELIRRYERVALSVAYGVLHDAAEAGDATQEAFLRAWQRLKDLQDPSKFGPWLCNIVRNLALDLRRRNRHVTTATANGIADPDAAGPANRPFMRLVSDPADEMQDREERDRVAAALAELDETTRTAVVMRYYDGASSKEIGEALGLNPAAIDMRLSRGRRQLKDLLEPDGATEARAGG